MEAGTRDSFSKLSITLLSVVATAGAAYFLFRPETKHEEARIVPTEGGLGLSAEEREMFIPTSEWQPVKDHHICPPGLEFRMNLADGSKFARLAPAS
jgi:hypothetical protein